MSWEQDGLEAIAFFARAHMVIQDLSSGLRATGFCGFCRAKPESRRAQHLAVPWRALLGREERRIVFGALRARDPLSAEREMRDHILSARVHLLNAFRSSAQANW